MKDSFDSVTSLEYTPFALDSILSNCFNHSTNNFSLSLAISVEVAAEKPIIPPYIVAAAVNIKPQGPVIPANVRANPAVALISCNTPSIATGMAAVPSVMNKALATSTPVTRPSNSSVKSETYCNIG